MKVILSNKQVTNSKIGDEIKELHKIYEEISKILANSYNNY